jgi:hypothetical protein
VRLEQERLGWAEAVSKLVQELDGDVPANGGSALLSSLSDVANPVPVTDN